MSDTRFPEPDARSLMRRIRARILAARHVDEPPRAARPGEAQPELPPELSRRPRAAVDVPAYVPVSFEPDIAPDFDGSYRLADLLRYYDEAFIRIAYLTILRREPDATGNLDHLRLIRCGTSKVDVLRSLRYSKEGRAVGVRIRGLRRSRILGILKRLPLAGRLLRMAAAVWNLDATLAAQRATENHVFYLLAEVQNALAANSDALRSGVHALDRHIRALDVSSTSAIAAVELGALEDRAAAIASMRKMKHRHDELAGRLESLRAEVDGNSVRDEVEAQRRALAEQDARLTELIEARPLRSEVEALASSNAALRQAIEDLQKTRIEASVLDHKVAELLALIEASGAAAREAAQSEIAPLREALQHAATAAALSGMASELRASHDQERARAEEAVRRAEGAWNAAAGELQRRLMDQEHGLGVLLEEARKRAPAPMGRKVLQAIVKEGDHLLDAMYARFEDRFRGARADIKNRQRIYVPYVRQAEAGGPKSPVIDLGCGRGEWLEVLRDEGLVARGVDRNRVFLDNCAQLELEALEGDCLDHLRSLKAGSAGAITAFHLIEHLPFDALIALLAESFRVLRPGGLLVLETPNPSNVVVGACNFYLDPTHRKPLPSELARYLVGDRGFVDVEVLPLHPVDPNWLQGATDRALLTLDQYFYGAQDYAVIGRKAGRR